MKRALLFLMAFAALVAVAGPMPVIDTAPEGYGELSACAKQDVLWENVQKTKYDKLPDFQGLGLKQLWSLWRQNISPKGAHLSDFAPEKWKKLLHRRAVLAKVRVVPREGSGYTGAFHGAGCALLRLSLTFKPRKGKKAVAPGLALKVLRDGKPSGNISALVSLEGQGDEYGFFKNQLTNIVAPGKKFGQKLVHNIFSKITHYPEELLAADLAATDVRGQAVEQPVAPTQLYFVPSPELNRFSSEPHDVREDLLTIPAGTALYELRASPEDVIADIVTTSEFAASSFGDDGIFFRHEIRP